jgi:hypothetical protein
MLTTTLPRVLRLFGMMGEALEVEAAYAHGTITTDGVLDCIWRSAVFGERRHGEPVEFLALAVGHLAAWEQLCEPTQPSDHPAGVIELRRSNFAERDHHLQRACGLLMAARVGVEASA